MELITEVQERNGCMSTLVTMYVLSTLGCRYWQSWWMERDDDEIHEQCCQLYSNESIILLMWNASWRCLAHIKRCRNWWYSVDWGFDGFDNIGPLRLVSGSGTFLNSKQHYYLLVFVSTKQIQTYTGITVVW